MVRVRVGALAAAWAVMAGCSGTSSVGRAGAVSSPDGPDGQVSLAGATLFVRSVDPFPVYDENGRAYDPPFLGGFNVPRPQFADIDGDGDLDLFLQERPDELMMFENVGTPSRPDFVWRTDRYQNLSVGEWTRFIDFDGDGDLDLLSERRFSYVQYFRNDGTARVAAFTSVGDSVRDVEGRPLFADRQNIPSLNDIDCDGDLDLFLGRLNGTISRYEVAELTDEGVPVFRFLEDRFQDIEIVAQLGSLHGANSMAFADIDQDGDLDFFWGDFFEPGVLFVENTGSCGEPNLRTDPVPFPTDDTIATSGYNVTVLEDVDSDGDLDLFVGVLGGAFNPNLTTTRNFHFYEQVDGDFIYRTDRFVYTLDVGSESIPSFADLDGDGDLDMLLANKLDPDDTQTSRLYYFENVGSPRNPAFQQRAHIPLFTMYHYAPALGDLDGDGDLDMLVGTWNAGVALYLNEGTRTEPEFVLQDTTFVRLTRGSNSAPALTDVDGDGDLDLFIGESSGELNFYRNVGTPLAPSFELVSDRFGEIDVGRRSFPTFADVDGDGDEDLLLGREEGGVLLYLRVGSTADGEPVFVLDSTFTLPLPRYSTPSLVDIDGDGDLDVFSGGLGGGLIFLEGR
ncbi:MAG: VCBS repeat-containing protein [Gemmatimonadetes bacterium]|nr:VCBS repeat-containing protein [Gemmatimonadota bacterium]